MYQMAVPTVPTQPKYLNVPALQPFMKKKVKRTFRKLGNGSFGVVEELVMNGTSCAGKKLHEVLLDDRDQGMTRVIDRFVSECSLMSTIRHPHIVQFIGLCEFEDSNFPVLIMEQLAMCLEELITKENNDKQVLPLSLKKSILTDTAKGLVYLHNHDPSIIHRDLTSRNILLTLSMQAKIADLGNALIIGPHTLTKTMTRVPGTAVYMPPEAIEVKPLYDTAIDMFSYGQLALYTVTQEFPSAMLPPTFTDRSSYQLLARSEIERRKPYFDILHTLVGKDHYLSEIIFQCLQNLPELRPSATIVLEKLQEAPKEMPHRESDFYYQFEGMSKLELIQLLEESKKRAPVQGAQSLTKVVSEVEETMCDYLPIVGDTSGCTSGSKLPWSLTEQKMNGVPGQLNLVKASQRKHGSIRRTTRRPAYTFQILGSTHLKYFDMKFKGEVRLSDIATVESLVSIANPSFGFKITFKENSKESPWTLFASSEAERLSWIEVLQPTAKLDDFSKSQPTCICQKHQDVLKSPLQSITKGDDCIKVQPNLAYQNQKDVFKSPQPPKVPLPKTPVNTTPVQPPVSSSYEYCPDYITGASNKVPTKAECGNHRPNPLQLEEVDGHLYTEIVSPPHSEEIGVYTEMNPGPLEVLSPSTSSNSKHESQGNSITLSSAPLNTQEQLNTLMQMFHKLYSSLNHEKPVESFERAMEDSATSISTGYDNDSDNLSPDELKASPPKTFTQGTEKLITETKPTTRKSSTGASNQTSVDHNPQQQSDNKANPCASSSSLRKRPSDLSINIIPNGNPAPNSQMIEEIYEEISSSPEKQGIPSLVIESPKDELSKPDMKAKKGKKTAPKSQTGLLDPDVLKTKLDKMLRHTSRESLLATDDDSDDDEVRPDWARASTGTTPIPSPQPQDGVLSMLRQHLLIKRTDLQNIEQIGQGHFGKVHKATLRLNSGSSATVVAKTLIRYKSEQEMGDFFHEMGIMSEMMHPNIIHLYGIIQEDTPTIVLEYFENRDLKSYLIKYKRSVDQLVKYMIDIAMGMHYIAEKGLIHRDLAARNVMVSDNETCKVADFGLLRELPRDDSIYHAKTSIAWPIRWMAPESLTDREFSSASDVWSFGILLWEMLYPDVLPYSNLDNVQCATKVCAGFRLTIPEEYPSTVKKIMKACWLKKPKKRPSFLLLSSMLTKFAFQGN